MLVAISCFITVFLLVLAITGQLDKGRSVKRRMDRYIDHATAEEKKPALAEDEFTGASPIREMIESFGKLVEKRAWVHWLDLQLAKAEVPLKGYEFFLIELVIAAGFSFVCFVIKPNPISVLVAALIGAGLPILWLRRKQQKRLLKFNSQISDALVLISNSLKAGYGFFQAMEMVAREGQPPIKTEFARVLKEINLGMTTEESLVRMVERVPSPDWDLVVTAMLIQRQIGGNLSEILDNITNTIRERIRIKQEIKTLTAQGRLSGMIIGFLPGALGLFVLLVNPDYVMMLFKDIRGLMMMGYAVVAELLAVMAIRTIIRVDI